MEKRHQITKIEKYKKEIMLRNITIYFSVAALTLALPTLAFELNFQIKSIFTILDSAVIPIASYNVFSSTIQKYYYKQKIEELEKQKNLEEEEEDQVRVR